VRYVKGSTDEGVSDIPAPDDAGGEERYDEEETIDKLKLGAGQMKFVLLLGVPC
jgi:hypothetical protein